MKDDYYELRRENTIFREQIGRSLADLQRAMNLLEQMTKPNTFLPLTNEEQKLYKTFCQSVKNVEFSTRAMNLFYRANIRLLGEICFKSEREILKYRDCGKRTLGDIKDKLDELGLHLNYECDDALKECVLMEVHRVNLKAIEDINNG